MGDPLGTSGFVGFLEKVKKGGPFTLIRFCRLRLKSKKKTNEDSLETKKIEKSKKVAQCRKKSKGGTP